MPWNLSPLARKARSKRPKLEDSDEKENERRGGREVCGEVKDVSKTSFVMLVLYMLGELSQRSQSNILCLIMSNLFYFFLSCLLYMFFVLIIKKKCFGPQLRCSLVFISFLIRRALCWAQVTETGGSTTCWRLR